MLKKTIAYTDFNGNTRTEDFYFNLSKAELAEWILRENLSGGLQELLERVVNSNDGRLIMDTFREIIIKSYGVKSEDGRFFNKSADLSSGFMGSEAYSVLFMELISDANAAAVFVNGIVPADMAQHSPNAPGNRPVPQDFKRKDVREQHRVEQVPDLPAAPPVLETETPALQPAQDEEYQEYLRLKTAREQNVTPRPPHESGPQGV